MDLVLDVNIDLYPLEVSLVVPFPCMSYGLSRICPTPPTNLAHVLVVMADC